MNQDIVNVISAYKKSLNTSDMQAALALYGDDPVFMPEFSAALSVATRLEPATTTFLAPSN